MGYYMKSFFFKLFIISCVLLFFFVYVRNVSNTSVSGDPAEVALSDKYAPMTRSERKIISDLIVQTIRDGLDGKQINYPDLDAYPPKWRALKTVYTTINIGSKLRGCQGNFKQEKPFLHAIVDSAYAAAFRDSRFSKLTQKEFEDPDFNFYITVLSEKKPLSFKDEKDIIRQLVPFQYGVILTYKPENKSEKRGLFLPSVWKKNPDPKQFWQKLKKKAHIKENFFSNQFQVTYFPAETIRDLDFIQRQDEVRIQSALTAYKKLFQSDGHVQYEVNFGKEEGTDKNNLVREMGSGYGLAYTYYITHDQTLQPIVKRFLTYVQSMTVPHRNGVLISDNPDKAPAGASAFALLAILYYEQESQDTSFRQLRENIKNGLVSLFEENVGIHRSPICKATSPHYDGETWLSLVMYHIFYPEDKILSKLIPNFNKTMYDKYSDKYLYSFFHWGTQAAAHYFAKTQDPLMHDFLKKQLNIYIDTIPFQAKFSTCSYAEGLGEAALALQGRDEALYKKVLVRLENQLDAVRLLQDVLFQKDKQGKVNLNAKPYLGLFLRAPNRLKTRNDVTQHCLSALLKAQLVFRNVQ